MRPNFRGLCPPGGQAAPPPHPPTLPTVRRGARAGLGRETGMCRKYPQSRRAFRAVRRGARAGLGRRGGRERGLRTIEGGRRGEAKGGSNRRKRCGGYGRKQYEEAKRLGEVSGRGKRKQSNRRKQEEEARGECRRRIPAEVVMRGESGETRR